MATMSPRALPHVVVGNLVELTLADDPISGGGQGIQFSQLRHKEGANFDFTLTLDDVTHSPLLATSIYDGRPWELQTRFPGEQYEGHGIARPFSPAAGIDPPPPEAAKHNLAGKDAQTFNAYNADSIYGGAESTLLCWKGVHDSSDPSPDRDSFWVNVLVRLEAAGSRGVEIYGWFGPERGSSAAVDYFVCPRLLCKGHHTQRGGEDHWDASVRTRVLMQMGITIASPRSAPHNLPLSDMWQNLVAIEFPVTLHHDHPGAPQAPQFFAMYSADDNIANVLPYRRTLYLQTTDTNWYQKRYTYRGHRYDPAGANEGWIEYGQTYIPSYARDLSGSLDGDIDRESQVPGNDGDIPQEDEFSNSYSPRYSTIIGALTAVDDTFWFDVCKEYRTWFEANIAGLIDLADRSDLTLIQKGEAFFYFFGSFAQAQWSGPTKIHAEVEAEIARVKGHLANIFVPAVGYVQRHTTLVDNKGGLNPNVNIDQDVGVQDHFRALANAGTRVSAFTIFSTLARGDGPNGGWDVPVNLLRVGRSGTPVGAFVQNALGGHMDNSHKAARDYQLNRFLKRYIADASFSQLYVDVTIGIGNRLDYHKGTARFHVAHGGNYETIGRLDSWEFFREAIRKGSYMNQIDGTGTDPDATIGSETFEEPFVGKYDIGLPAYDWLHNHMLLAEPGLGSQSPAPEVAYPVITDYPVEARDPCPPMIEAIYNKWQGVTKLCMPPSRSCLATESLLHPGPSAEPGMTPAETFDMHAFMHSQSWVTGMNIVSFDMHIDDFHSFLSQADGVKDPTAVGAAIWAFFKLLYQGNKEDYGGQFLTFGEMERPLLIDYLDGNNGRQNNPVNVAKTKCNILEKMPYTIFGNNIRTGLHVLPSNSAIDVGQARPFDNNQAAFDVPQVLHGMWRRVASPTTTVGLILVNWSAAAGDWRGTFDPLLYGFLAGSYTIGRLTLGNPTSRAVLDTRTVAAGTFDLVSNFLDPGGSTLHIGHQAARSVDIITFQPV